jgi:hypothetical protein
LISLFLLESGQIDFAQRRKVIMHNDAKSMNFHEILSVLLIKTMLVSLAFMMMKEIGSTMVKSPGSYQNTQNVVDLILIRITTVAVNVVGYF